MAVIAPPAPTQSGSATLHEQVFAPGPAAFVSRPAPVTEDPHYLDLEVAKIATYLRPSDHVLDIGCGDGRTTCRYASQCARIVGIDRSPDMVAAAQRELARQPNEAQGRAQFTHGDARRLPFPAASFSRIISLRCLAAIPRWEEQFMAVGEFARVLHPGGLLLLSEATLQGHERVDHYRRRFGLPALRSAGREACIDEVAFLAGIAPLFERVETVRFGMYGFLSKIVLPLLSGSEAPPLEHPLNEVAARIAREIPDFGQCIPDVLFVLRRK